MSVLLIVYLNGIYRLGSERQSAVWLCRQCWWVDPSAWLHQRTPPSKGSAFSHVAAAVTQASGTEVLAVSG